VLNDFPKLKRGAVLHTILYEGSPSPSIYSSHIRRLTEHCALSIFRMTLQKFRSRDRGAHIAVTRQTAMYLAHVTFGLSFSEIGQLFGRDRTTVAHACHVVEDLRDDPAMDRALAVVEATLAGLRFNPC
jgi:chromosomal replication initiation ATPase DnaA